MPYPRHLFILLCLGAMDALAGFAILTGLAIVDAGPLHGMIFWLLLLATWVGTAVEIFTSGAGERTAGIRILVVLVAFATCVVPPVLLLRNDIAADVLSAFLLALFFWRGMLITPKEVDHYEVQRRFGLRLAFVLLGIVILVARGETETQSLWLMLSLAGIAYVATGFAALGASRLDEARSADTGPATAMAVGVPVAVLIVLSLGALSVFSTNLLGGIGAILGPIWDVVSSGIALLATVLAIPLFFILSQLHLGKIHGLHLTPPRVPRSGRAPAAHGTHHGITVWDIITTALVVLLILLLALLIMALILRVARARQPKPRERKTTEERRPLATPGQMVHLFLAWLRGLFHRGARTAMRAVETTRHRVLGPSYPPDPIRRVYAQLLHRAARQGLARSPTTTPAEFELHLRSHWPEGGSHFAAVTEAYMRRRYAERPSSDEDVRTIREHWHRLRQLMRSA